MTPKSKALKKMKYGAEIIIIRHGETELNKDGRIRGWSDVPLDEKGREEAKKLGGKLTGKIDVLVCSDLDRGQETAYFISRKTGIPISDCSKGFRPWNVGEYTGAPVTEVHPIMKELATKAPDKKIDHGESFNSFRDRFLNAIEDIVEKHPGERIGVVTHHRGDRIFAAWHKAGFPENYDVDLDVFLTKGIEPGDYCSPVLVTTQKLKDSK